MRVCVRARAHVCKQVVFGFHEYARLWMCAHTRCSHYAHTYHRKEDEAMNGAKENNAQEHLEEDSKNL